MNKQIFLSIALLALASFSGAMGVEGTGTGSTNSLQTEKTEKTVTTTEKTDKESKKESSSVIGSAYNNIRAFGSEHAYAIAGGALAVLAITALYKAMYKNCPWFKELVDGNEAERTQVLPWGTAIN